ncbi:MAG TPA: ribulose-phosphate 3-epimerase [Gemmatimonadetes bacterium]|nr:ribulose-phosphate 3-epimerase [Gemmatimonadota bacterium]HIB09188.1 ribulose-phosphate 3-epimerase [Gemmatimonadota bacterium]HIN78997.1 ribulose-phosphate 3-epimerase [Gemmatimonadota bacterium]
MMKIAPSILSCDFSRLGEEIRAVEAGGADWIHVDVMDGHFVPNITIGPVITKGARRSTDLPLDVHLMIESPEEYLESFVEAGATFITIHVEACRNLTDTLDRIHSLGVKAGVAINPETPLEEIGRVLRQLDLLVIMSVNPGFGGQGYIPGSTEKVAAARSLLDRQNSSAELEVDGGVGASNAADLQSAGASVLVAGSAVYRHPEGPGAGVRTIREALIS